MLRTHYINELESVRRNLVEMGETTIALFNEAQRSIADPSPSRSATATELEAKTDVQHRDIHDQCLGLITLQAPVAGDARLVTGILDAIVDLELIGDYSHEIVAFCLAIQRRLPSQVLSQTDAIAAKVSAILRTAIDSWRSGDRSQALSVRSQEAAIRAECESMYEKTFATCVRAGRRGRLRGFDARLQASPEDSAAFGVRRRRRGRRSPPRHSAIPRGRGNYHVIRR